MMHYSCSSRVVDSRSLHTVQGGECGTDQTLEQRALGAYAGQDAHAHQYAEQMLR
jgi:hypothetical protein